MVGFELQRVHRLLAGSDNSRYLLEDVSVTFAPGQLHALVGPSGGGKTSLLRLLNRLDVPDEGRILLDGRDLADWSPRLLRRSVGFVPQQPHMFPGSARDNLLYGLRFHDQPRELAKDRISEVCAQCQLPVELLQRAADRLSIGEQQRLALGRALCLDPLMLLLDEPTSALDRPTAEALGRTLRQLCASGIGIVLVSHDLSWVRSYADRVLFIAAGRLELHAETPAFFDQPGVGPVGRFIAGEDQAERE